MSGMLVKQRTNTDCGVACIAMALGKYYDEVWDRLTDELKAIILEKGMMDEHFKEAMDLMGFVYEEHYTKRVFSPHWGTVGYSKNLIWGRRAILAVRSRNFVDGWHFIYWDGHNVMDPSNLDTYTNDNWHECEPRDYWIFNEA